MVTNVIPIYYACVGILQESLIEIIPESALYLGIKSCIEKLNCYYDKISPMIGIALILDPSKKKDFLYELDWQENWIMTVSDQFEEVFEIYKPSTLVDVPAASELNMGLSLSNYMKRKRPNLNMSGETELTR